MNSALAAIYVGCVLMLGCWGVHRWLLVRSFRRSSWRRSADLPESPEPHASLSPSAAAGLPSVVVQLPLYNERGVVERLIEAAGDLDYPRELLEIQVLDDSTDETRALAEAAVRRLVEGGVRAVHLHRSDREGYKAGALDHGLRRTEADLVAVFDADFLPPRDFLTRTVGEFEDPSVGLVQARWGHINRDESTFTRAQSTLLDGHFVIEHTARASEGLFFNFNGTAGVWRRSAIEDAGGWEHDTLTEDLDLSYRAQLRGWRFVYRPDVVAPAEVPSGVSAFKNQQHRWACGSAQVLRKLGPRLLRSEQPWRVRIEALLHLGGNIGYPLVLVLALTMPLALDLRGAFGHLVHAIGFLVCSGTVVLFYGTSQAAVGRSRGQRLRDVPASLALGVGLSISQTLAVFKGLIRRAGEFVRTPKRGDGVQPAYRSRRLRIPGIELAVAAWIAAAMVRAVDLGRYGALPFLFLFAAGFGWVGWLSLRDMFPRAEPAASA